MAVNTKPLYHRTNYLCLFAFFFFKYKSIVQQRSINQCEGSYSNEVPSLIKFVLDIWSC